MNRLEHASNAVALANEIGLRRALGGCPGTHIFDDTTPGRHGGNVRILLIPCLIMLLSAPLLRGQSSPTANDQLLARMIEREHEVTRDLARFHPIVETYVQVMTSRRGELTPSYDRHFVSLAEFAGELRALRFKPRHSEIWRDIDEFSDSLKPTTLEYNPSGFVAMAYPEPSTFDLMHYRFQFLTRESLGDVRCIVFQVSPASMRKSGLFEGKVWVEDESLTIVRFKGIFRGTNMTGKYSHFDSWRVKTQPGLWVPAIIYSEETGLPCCGFWKLNWTKIRFKAETRFWGYDPHSSESREEFTRMFFDASGAVSDLSSSDRARGPVDQKRLWERQAELNVTDQLERIGLLSPIGEVEKTLQTVLHNIEVANNLSVEPEVRCRVLLTSNLESAVIGHTIILSRGLLDVLPGETALAAVLAHNLARVTLGDQVDANFAWVDQVMFDPREVMRKLRFAHSPEQEEQASLRAQQWMLQSPYKLSLDSVTGFMEELRSRSPHIHQLLQASIGDGLYETLGAGYLHSSVSVTKDIAKVRALPLGSRIRVDPWTGETTFVQAIGTELLSKSRNMPFEISPLVPCLRQMQSAPTSEVSSLKPTEN